jgi:hypothetical protein
MLAALAPESTAKTVAKASPRDLYTYLIKPLGPVTTVAVEGQPEELVMRAALTRTDGTARNHVLRVRGTEKQPDMVDRVRTLLAKGVPVRMVVQMQRVVRTSPSEPGVRVNAIAETLLEPKRAPASVQLDLFG